MLLGMLSFDANGNIVETNQEARRILAEKDGIWLSGNNICIESSQESRDLQRILRSAMAGTNSGEGPGVVEAIAVTRPSGRAKLGIIVRAIPLGRWSESKQRPAVAVFVRSEEHTSELQSLMRISYAVFCLKKKKQT